MAYTFKNPGHWEIGEKVNKGDIFQMIINRGAHYFEALFDGVILNSSYELPTPGQNNNYWRSIKSPDRARYTIGNAGTWQINTMVIVGDIFKVTQQNIGNENGTNVGDFYKSLFDGEILDSSYNFPKQGQDNDKWIFVGNYKPILYTFDNPGFWGFNLPVKRGYIFQVVETDNSGNPELIVGDYYQAQFEGAIYDQAYPDGREDNPNWQWLGSKTSTEIESGSPVGVSGAKTWRLDEKVVLGDIFKITEDDITNESKFKVGDFYRATFQGHIKDTDVYAFPDDGKSNDSWISMGSFITPLIWKHEILVTKGAIFQVKEKDIPANPELVVGDYYQALFDGKISKQYYPEGREDNSNWQWLGSKTTNELESGTPVGPGEAKTWRPDEKVVLGDIFKVTEDDITDKSKFKVDDCYKAIFQGRIPKNPGNDVCYKFPSDGKSNNSWVFAAGHDDWAEVRDLAVKTAFQNEPVTIFANGLNMVRIDVHMTPINWFGNPVTVDQKSLIDNIWLVNYETGEHLIWRGEEAPTVNNQETANGWFYTTGYNKFTEVVDHQSSRAEDNSSNDDGDGTPGKTIVKFYVFAKDLTPDQGKQGIAIGAIVKPAYNPAGEVDGYLGGGGLIIMHASVKVRAKLDLAITDLSITKSLIRPNPNDPDDGDGYDKTDISVSNKMFWRQFNFNISFVSEDRYKRRIFVSRMNSDLGNGYVDKITNGYHTKMFMVADDSLGKPTGNIEVDMGAIGRQSVSTGQTSSNIVITYIMYLDYEHASSLDSRYCSVTIYDGFGNSYIIYPSYQLPNTYLEVKGGPQDTPWEQKQSNLISITNPALPNKVEPSKLYGLYNVDKKVYILNGWGKIWASGNIEDTVANSAALKLQILKTPKPPFVQFWIYGASYENGSRLMAPKADVLTGDSFLWWRKESELSDDLYCTFLPIWDKQQIFIYICEVDTVGFVKVGEKGANGHQREMWMSTSTILNHHFQIVPVKK